MYGAAKKKAVKLDKLKNEYALLDDAYAQTQEEKVDLQEAVQSELTSKLVQCENSQFDHDRLHLSDKVRQKIFASNKKVVLHLTRRGSLFCQNSWYHQNCFTMYVSSN